MGLNSLCSLSVHLRYYSKNTFVRLHNKDLFLTVLEAGKSKIKVPKSVLDEGYSPGYGWLASSCVGQWSSLGSLFKNFIYIYILGGYFVWALILFMRVHSYDLNHFSKAPTSQ